MRYTVGDPDRVLRLARGIRFERLDLSIADGFFLSRVDGSLSGNEVMELLPLGGAEAQRVLFRLVCAGIVELSGPPKPARPLPEIATLAAERAARMAKSRPAPETPVEEDVARESLVKAEGYIAEGRPDEAARILETVVNLVAGDLRNRVRRVLADALLRDPASLKRGEEQLHVLIAENPSDTEGFFALGKVYRARGLRQRADAMFRRVLDLDPSHEGAREALPAEKAAPPPPLASPGFFGRFFSRDSRAS
jgi:tetratricopeptide (TPR) repeat protein